MRAPVAPVTDRRSSSASIHRRTPDRWDFSRTTTASGDSTNSLTSSSSVTSTLSVVAKAFGSCFGKQTQQQQQPPDYSPLTSSSASSSSSRPKRSGKGMMMYATSNSNNNSKRRSSSSSRHNITCNNINRSGQIGDIFIMRDIHKATKNFSPSLKIGQGGFGTVYRGTLGDGTVVAVKRAKKSVYDNHLGREFQSEIQTLARVEHINLVRFLGYLECEDERIVVVEYVPNGTLREHLDCVHGGHLDVGARLDIAIDVAHAVTYLHTYTDHPIIHRDIKSSNILLTENLRAKVADFGFARLGATEPGVTHVSTQVKGTAGYLDPEYLRTYQLTEKSDVYSFGVLLVELISGRRPIESKRDIRERVTPKWAMKKFTDGNAIHILDPNLPQNPATNLALEKILELALHCLAPTRQGRPSMQRCAEILWSIRKDYRELLASDALANPSRPSFMEDTS